MKHRRLRNIFLLMLGVVYFWVALFSFQPYAYSFQLYDSSILKNISSVCSFVASKKTNKSIQCVTSSCRGEQFLNPEHQESTGRSENKYISQPLLAVANKSPPFTA